MSAFPRPLRNVAAHLALALGWPARVIEARETRARLAELSERERQDIGGVRQEGADQPVDETPGRAARPRCAPSTRGTGMGATRGRPDRAVSPFPRSRRKLFAVIDELGLPTAIVFR